MAELDSSITWKDIQWLKSITNMAIVVKGVMTPEDAILAVEHGVSAVWVSNHGGRQLDTVPATVSGHSLVTWVVKHNQTVPILILYYVVQ